MPHQTRHKKKKKKPKRIEPLSIQNDEQLREHRELAMLRIAGGARPGKKKQRLMNERIDKLNEAERRASGGNS